MIFIKNIVDALMGRKRWEDATGGALVSPGPMAAAGCSPSWQKYDSTNYVEWDPQMKVQIHDYTLVDNGDDVYDPKMDHWEDFDGKAADPMKDKAFITYLNKRGIEPEALNGVRISALAQYMSDYADAIDAIKRDSKGENVWQRYEALVGSAGYVNVAGDFKSALYEAIVSVTGAPGCYIPLTMAEGAAGQGDLSAMRLRLGAAVLCASERELADENFHERVNGTRLTGYRAAMDAIVEKHVKSGNIKKMMEELVEMYESAKEDKVVELIEDDLQAAAIKGHEKSMESILTNGLVKEQARNGSVVRLEEMVEEIANSAEEFKLGGEVKVMAKRTRIAGYFKALAGIEDSYAKVGNIVEMNEKLDALQASAKAKGILNTIGYELREVRIKGYLAAIDKVKKDNEVHNDREKTEGELNEIYNSAKSYRIVSGFRHVISAVRREAKQRSEKK